MDDRFVLLANQLRNLADAIHARRGRFDRAEFLAAWEKTVRDAADEIDPHLPDLAGDGVGAYELTDLGRAFEP